MRCPSCGADNSEAATFCSLCYQPLGAAASDGAEQHRSPEPPGDFNADPVPSDSYLPPAAPIAEPNGAGSAAQSGPAWPYESEPLPPPPVPRGPYFAGVVGWLGTTQGKLVLRLISIVVILTIPFVTWALNGGLLQSRAARSTTLTVPVGSQLVGSNDQFDGEGNFGPLSDKERQAGKLRAYAVALPPTQAAAYYQTGSGRTAMREAGWGEPGEVVDNSAGWLLGWVRTLSTNARTTTRQEAGVFITGDPALVSKFCPGARPQSPGGGCFVVIFAQGYDLENVEVVTK